MLLENINCWILNNIDLFSHLPFDLQYELHHAIKEVKLDKNEFLFREGDPMTNTYIIKEGRVKIIKSTSQDKECIKHILKSQDVYGEFAVLDAESYSYFRNSGKIMDNDTSVYVVPNHVLVKICKENRKTHVQLIGSALKKYRHVDERLESVTLSKSKERVIDFIKELARDIGRPIGYEMLIRHNLTHQEIANITGISRQKVTTILNELKQDGMIHLERNEILIHEMSLLD